LKTALTQGPVLALPDFSLLFQLETDASGMGIGVVLTQNKHPVAYFSKNHVIINAEIIRLCAGIICSNGSSGKIQIIFLVTNLWLKQTRKT